MPEIQVRAKPLSGVLVGISAGDSQDVQAYGLLPRHLDIVLSATAGALVLRGARIAYGGDLRARGFTELLYQNVGEAYADEVFLGEKPGAPPFVHYLAANIWAPLPDALETWLSAGAGLVEVRFMTGDDYIAVRGVDGKFVVGDGGETLPKAADVMKWLKARAPQAAEPAPSLALMRKALGRDCDARILLGGKMFDYAGSEPGIPAEARESIDEGAALLPLGGFGGAARDVAMAMGLAPKEEREGTKRGLGYAEAMAKLETRRALASAHLDGAIEQAQQLATTTDPREAARLVVDILLKLPKRAPPARRGQ
jgi:hypothetical protein